MNRRGFFWGLILLVLGALFMLDNIGFLGVSVWSIFWPALLLILGAWYLARSASGQATAEEEVAIPWEGASKGRIVIRHGAGRLSLRGGAPPDLLLEGVFGGGLAQKTWLDGATLHAELSVPNRFSPFGWGPGQQRDWEIRLSQSRPLALTLATGASNMRLDLSDLLVSELDIETGASATWLRLPAQAGHTEVSLRSGVASVTIEVPATLAAAIELTGGLAEIQVDSERFPRQGGKRYRSPDYDSAANRANIRLDSGLGSLRILGEKPAGSAA
jgi:hypothetical protein